MKRLACVLTMLWAATAAAQTTESNPPPPDGGPPVPQSTLDASASPGAPPPKDEGPKKPGKGDFDAGGQARFPSGPDNDGNYASFNWVAVDLKGRYFILDSVTVNANVPLAVKKPDMPMVGGATVMDPSLFGGMTLNLDARLPSQATIPGLGLKTDLGLALTLGYMREGAMLLSEKDFPLFVGDMKPGLGLGVITKIKLSSLLDFALLPSWVYQSGTMESLTALQIPLALQVALGSLLKVNVELGVYTGDDYSFSAAENGRIAAGASVDVKLGPILLHAGAGAASLITDPAGFYPTISDSIYVDLNVKYAK